MGEHRGRGEAAPAWWIGESSLARAKAELDGLAASAERNVSAILNEMLAFDSKDNITLQPQTLLLRVNTAHRRFLETCSDEPGPSVTAALQSSLLDLIGRYHGIAAWKILAAGFQTTETAPLIQARPLALLIAGAKSSDLRLAARNAAGRGYTTLKVKVGNLAPSADIARVRAVLEETPREVRLRLDANRSWSLAQFQEFATAAQHPRVEFVEEPLATEDADSVSWLGRECPLPVAFDESIQHRQDLERIAKLGIGDVVVLKTARLGGPIATVGLACRARELGLRIVITDSIETSVGQAAALHTAAVVCDPDTAVGLGGAAMLCEDGTTATTPSARIPGPGLRIENAARNR